VFDNIIAVLATFWNVLLLVFAILTLLGFCYFIFVRRVVRARRIAHARDRRLLREAAERESGDS